MGRSLLAERRFELERALVAERRADVALVVLHRDPVADHCPGLFQIRARPQLEPLLFDRPYKPLGLDIAPFLSHLTIEFRGGGIAGRWNELLGF
ncbi:MAG: hypothetical protein D6690_05050 [Nitrospirae bacterium]|nr:MAG: hypothetical protein D6690_05050 [Nitrospirota bacterium]